MTQPSGWYDDPQDPGALRYWDGILWTDNTVPKTSPTAAASTIGRPDFPHAPSPGGGYAGGPASGPYPSGVQDRQPPPAGYGAPPPAGYGGLPPAGYGAPPPAGYGYGAAPQVAWPPVGPTSADGVPLAQWWQRLLARIVDGIITGVLTTIAALPWTIEPIRRFMDLFAQMARDAERGVNSAVDQSAVNAEMAKIMVPLTLVTVVVSLVYETFFLVRWGATPGKRILGIAVRRVGRPGPLTLVEALRRQVLPRGLDLLGLVPGIAIVANLVSLLDNLWLLWDPRRQALHDKVADTLVVRALPRR
ncbi:MAG: RDD family protein [Dermatophilaceae bacterium]